MDTTAYLDDFVSSLEHLPRELQQILGEIRERDAEQWQLKGAIKEIRGRIHAMVAKGNGEAPSADEFALIEKVQGTFKDLERLSDDKVQRAERGLAIMEKTLRRLEVDLRKLSFDLDIPPESFGLPPPAPAGVVAPRAPDVALSAARAPPRVSGGSAVAAGAPAGGPARAARSPTGPPEIRVRAADAPGPWDAAGGVAPGVGPARDRPGEGPPAGADAAAPFGRTSPRPGARQPSPSGWAGDGDRAARPPKRRAGSAQPPAVADAARTGDADEGVYCYCHQPSYGAMVACDSPACPIEWFHLGCVGLAELPPQGARWYCDECKAAARARSRPPRASSPTTGPDAAALNPPAP